ncbi:MAG: ATP-binding protein [Acidobacteria bacterium]|nr:ATP-binding protein [Acidobacteriota bacterium]
MNEGERKKDRVLVGWSGGKDSAMALYELKSIEHIEIAALLTTVTEGYDRISMHGVRRELLVKQAGELGYPLEEISIPQNCTNETYEQRMRATLERYQREGISAAVFGDLYLEGIRAYREERMGRIGMRCIFPVWGRPTAEFAGRFIDLGFRAIVVCVDTQALELEFAGRDYDRDFIRDLPASADPCGENGEFHTFVYDGPIFRRPVEVQRGEKVLRDNRFYYCDLI